MRRQDTDTATCRRVPITAAAGGTGWGEAPCPHPRSILNPHEPIPDPMFPSQTPPFPFPITLCPQPRPQNPYPRPLSVSPSQICVSPSWTQCPCPRPDPSDPSILILYPSIPRAPIPAFPAAPSHTPVSPVPLTLVADSPYPPALGQEPGAQSGHLPQVRASTNQ